MSNMFTITWVHKMHTDDSFYINWVAVLCTRVLTQRDDTKHNILTNIHVCINRFNFTHSILHSFIFRNSYLWIFHERTLKNTYGILTNCSLRKASHTDNVYSLFLTYQSIHAMLFHIIYLKSKIINRSRVIGNQKLNSCPIIAHNVRSNQSPPHPHTPTASSDPSTHKAMPTTTSWMSHFFWCVFHWILGNNYIMYLYIFMW